jgi:spoIIIJ-associated protein
LSVRYSVHETGPRIEQFLHQTIAAAGFRLGFQLEPGDHSHPDFENPDLLVKFQGEDVDLLLANRAELLLALELVTQEMLRMHSDDHSRISFDANDYRALRIEELRASALAAAEKVKHTGNYFRFNPMNSRERRIIHIALRNDHDVRSESAGVGPQRGCVIYPASMPSIPDLPPLPVPRPPPPPGSRPEGRGERGFDRRGGRPGGRPGSGPPRRGPR